jgi:hypothetical protein
VMLALSLLLALISLAGIVWMYLTKTLMSVDGLFMSLILLTLSGVFLLNALMEMKAQGWLGGSRKGDAPASKTPSSAKPD